MSRGVRCGSGGAGNCQAVRSSISHHPVAGKELAGLLVSGWVGQLRGDGGVLDVDVSQSVFDKRQAPAGVLRNPHDLGIVFKLRAAGAANRPKPSQSAALPLRQHPHARDVPPLALRSATPQARYRPVQLQRASLRGCRCSCN